MSPVRPDKPKESAYCKKAHRGRALTLDRIVERQNMNALAVLDVVAGVNGGNVTKLDAQIVASDCAGDSVSAAYQLELRWTAAVVLSSPLFTWILPSSTSSDDRTMRTVE